MQNLINQATLLIESGEYKQAFDLCEQGLAVEPDNVEVLGRYLQTLYDLMANLTEEEIARVWDNFNKALSLNLNNAKTWTIYK